MFSPYLGPVYNSMDGLIHDADRRIKIAFVGDQKYRLAANSIAKGKIIAWYQGRSECGPRALGNRSILADPRDPKMKDVLNIRIKHREDFRPFAPAVLWEYQTIYFELSVKTPYMLMIADVKPTVRSRIPAVVHVDGTARLQTVDATFNKSFYRLIQEYMYLTGIPMVLNTSFNVQGEPIVETPKDALRCFLSTDIDELYLDNLKLDKMR